MANVCEGCVIWEQFKEKCHFYWEGKRICTQFKENLAQAPCVKERE